MVASQLFPEAARSLFLQPHVFFSEPLVFGNSGLARMLNTRIKRAKVTYDILIIVIY